MLETLKSLVKMLMYSIGFLKIQLFHRHFPDSFFYIPEGLLREAHLSAAIFLRQKYIKH